ncbi:MAG: tripartite tricarboxylate transporter substrate binding protein, partial [Alphaproteobacteria bacterium]|nr:tripartite tricarboxylate transporter substrate binding protein [Alphaproteobacteria bacterium]
GMDTSSRIVVESLKKVLGVSFRLINKPAGGGIGGLEEALREPADGYTMSIVLNLTATRPLFAGQDKPFDMTRVAYVGRYAANTRFIVANKDAPYNDLGEMLEWAAKNPGKLRYAEAGRSHQAQVKLLAEKYNAEIQWVWFNSGGDVANAQIGGHVDASGNGTGTAAMGAVLAGNLKVLANLGSHTIPGFPDLKSITDFGAERAIDAELGFVIKAGTDEAMRQKLEDALKTILEDPEVRKRMINANWLPAFMPGKEWGEKSVGDAEAAYAVYQMTIK